MKLKSPILVGDDALSTRSLLLTLNKRLITLAVTSVGAVIIMAGAVFALIPLKETVPYIVEVSQDGSAVVPPQTPGVQYTPTEASRMYFIRRWVIDAFTINQYLTIQSHDPRARVMLRGANALSVYSEWLKADGKLSMLAADPTLVRDVEVLSITPIAGTDGGVIAEVALTTRTQGRATRERKVVTIYYDFFRLTDVKDVEVNPLGIFITDFKVGASNAR